MDKATAQAHYRTAWSQWCLTTDADRKHALEMEMDSVQGYCVDSGRPGPEWEAFIDTLPGYRAHWGALRDEANKMGRAMFGALWEDVSDKKGND